MYAQQIPFFYLIHTSIYSSLLVSPAGFERDGEKTEEEVRDNHIL